MALEIIILLVLIVLNGVLAMSELAVVSARPAKLKAMQNAGSKGAATALDLAQEPGRFLSAVQIGITLIGVLNGAVSGATLGTRLSVFLADLGLSAGLADPLGVGAVVALITYLSLVVGELVPKQIALASPEAVAARVAPFMAGLSRVAAPLVWLLDKSGNLLLRLLGPSMGRDQTISDEEIRSIIAEAESTGVIEKGETELIKGVMRVADRSARGLMTATRHLEIARTGESRDDLLRRFRESGHARLPVRDDASGDIIGVLQLRDLQMDSSAQPDLAQIAQPAPAVPETLPAMDAVDQLRASKGRMLLVYDEHGRFSGVIGAMDILDAIAGGFDDTSDGEPELVQRADGSYLAAGNMPVDEFAAQTGLKVERSVEYDTLAGLIMAQSAAMPQIGQRIELQGWQLEVVDMDGKRVDRLLAVPPSAADEE